ncbi:MAG: hypothetical protein M3R36_07155 [Bacteroidota bacterium]|nr:hypothetical protein [Bacteroidota bacterium]
MKSFFEYVKGILIRGIILLIPLFLIVFIVKSILGLLEELIHPIEGMLPSGSLFGLGMTRLTAFAIFILIVIVFGIFTTSKRGSKLNEKIENIVPGLKILKSILLGHQEMENNNLKVCLATIDDAWLYGFIVEEHESGMLTVFVPDAPSPVSGSVYFMSEKQVKRLDITAREVIKHIMQFGAGSKTVIDKKVKW